MRGDSLYWTEWGDGTSGRVMKAGLDGSSPRVLAAGQPKPTGLAVDESRVYFTTHLDPGDARAVPRDGGEVVTLTSELNLPDGLAFGGDTLYVAQNGGDRLDWFSLAGGAATSYSTGAVDSPAGRAADERYLYWANQGPDVIFRMAPTELAPTPLMTAEGFLTGVTVDASAVYWVANQGGAIYRLAKSLARPRPGFESGGVGRQTGGRRRHLRRLKRAATPPSAAEAGGDVTSGR